jgi:uncharacterized protein (TIGR00369 family)
MAELPEFWGLFGIAIEHADESGVVLQMNVPDALMSPFGQVFGGAVAALFDTGLAVAIARQVKAEDRIATLNLNVGYTNFTSERVLRCRARVLSLRRTVAIVEGEITDESGTLVAKAVGTFAVRRG